MKRWLAIALSSATVVAVIGAGQGVPTTSPVAAQERQGTPPGQGSVDNNEERPSAQSAGELALPGTTYWGVVQAGGGLTRHRGGVSATRLSEGRYAVIFLDNITQCAFTGTIGLPGFAGAPPTGQIAVVGRAGDARGVFVETSNSGGTAADRPFHLVVNC